MDEKDCSFTRGNKWFRYRVGAIIVEDGCVLLARDSVSDYYYSVGGGVHHGETSREAIEREVFEETGVHYEADRLAVIHENFFGHDEFTLKGLDCHELAFYYIMKPRGTRDLPEHKSVSSGGEEHAVFVPIDRLGEIKMFPTFFREWLGKFPDHVIHIVTDEKKS